jgi:hypothetical protein
VGQSLGTPSHMPTGGPCRAGVLAACGLGGVEVLFPASRDCRRRSTTRARPSGLLWPASPSQGLFGVGDLFSNASVLREDKKYKRDAKANAKSA